jgi:flavin-dependent dehydrogenase
VGRDKVCGEFVSGEAAGLLDDLVPGLAGGAPVIVQTAWVSSRGRRAAFPLPLPGCGISRLRLDAALWEAAGAAGAQLLARTAATGYSAGELITAAGPYAAQRVLVAAGRWWSLPGLAAAPAASPWIGVKARFSGVPLQNTIELYLFRDGYCGLAPVENGWTNACCLIHRDAAGDLSATRDFASWIGPGNPVLRARLRPARQATATVVTSPIAMGARAAARGGALCIGDAVGFVDPFTGDGLARALLSAQLAIAHLDDPAAYARALVRAGGRSYQVGRALRWLTRAPAGVQDSALAALARPRLAAALFAATRYRTL